jgi:hypothetical protein
MMKHLVLGCVLALVVWPALAASAQAVDYQAMTQAETAAGGAWHFKSIPCAEGTVTDVTPRLRSLNQTVFTAQDFEQSGVAVSIRFAAPWRYLAELRTTSARVVHYQGTPGNALMQSERAGDRVQVCLVSFPVPRVDPSTKRTLCDPDRDPRGFEFRVYDYRQHAAYIGPDSQHMCGGA